MAVHDVVIMSLAVTARAEGLSELREHYSDSESKDVQRSEVRAVSRMYTSRRHYMDIEAISGGGSPFIYHFKYRKAEGLLRHYFIMF
jgi:hypothetical protein